MIQWYSTAEGQLVEEKLPEQATIIRLVAPTNEELAMTKKMTKAPEDFLIAATDRYERPRIETEDGVKLIILQVPHEENNTEIPFITAAFGIILTPQYVVTVSSLESPIWSVMQSGRLRIPSPANRIAFLCVLFLQIARLYLVYLQKIRHEADMVEREIHHSMKNKMLVSLLNLEKCLVYFTTSLRANNPIWDRFRRIHDRELTEDEMDLVEDVKIEFRQAQELSDIHSNILSGMMDAFASVISNNLNVVMKSLTSITVMLMIPTLIASIYGMNVELPFQHWPHAFLIIMVLSVALSLFGVVFLLKKKLF